jgi:gluconokinase
MVFIITGAAESDRNTVGRLLAEALGWEFVDAENLHPPDNLNARRCSTSLANADPTLRLETLSAAINFWTYEWRDVVVSCPMLTERDRRQLCRNTSLVRIVYLKVPHDTGRSTFLDRPAHFMSTELTTSKHAGLEPREKVLTVDLSQRIEEIIAEMVSALILNRRSPYAKTG